MLTLNTKKNSACFCSLDAVCCSAFETLLLAGVVQVFLLCMWLGILLFMR